MGTAAKIYVPMQSMALATLFSLFILYMTLNHGKVNSRNYDLPGEINLKDITEKARHMNVSDLPPTLNSTVIYSKNID